MRAIKRAKKIIEKSPDSFVALTFSKLILSLETDITFPMKDLYKLNVEDFELALDLLRDWRIDRFYIGKAKAFDIATHNTDLHKS